MMKRFFLNLFPEEIQGSHSFGTTARASILRFLGLGCIFLSHALLAQLMGAKGFGNYAVIFTCLSILIACSLFSFDKSVATIYSNLAEQQQWNKISGFLKFSRKTILSSSFVMAIALFVVLINTSGKYGVTFSEAIFWALLLFPMLALIQYDTAVMRVMQRPSLFSRSANPILTIVASMVCLIYFEWNNKILKTDAAVFIYLCCAFCLYVFNSASLKKTQYRLPWKDVTNEFERKAWLSASALIFFPAFFTLLMNGMGVIFISYFFGNSRAGIYAAAVMASTIFAAYIAIPQSLFLPRIRELYENRLRNQMQKLMSKWTKTAFILFFPVGFTVIVLGKFILQLFGTTFGASYVPLVILIFGQLVNFRFGMVTAVLLSGRVKKKHLFISMFVVILDLALHYLLVSPLGMNGAALAAVLSLTTLNLLMYVQARKSIIMNQ